MTATILNPFMPTRTELLDWRFFLTLLALAVCYYLAVFVLFEGVVDALIDWWRARTVTRGASDEDRRRQELNAASGYAAIHQASVEAARRDR